MLLDISYLAAESDHRRAALLADAENFRLARLARAARRAYRRPVAPPSDPPRPAGAAVRSGRTAAARDGGVERRYAVSR